MSIITKPKTRKESLDIRLGSDCKFPIQDNFQTIKGLDVLLQDIQRLLLTIPGERINRPTWGCSLRTLIWENIDQAAPTGAGEIKSSLDKFEPRITVSGIESSINRNTDLITFIIRFAIKSTDISVNLIFPFRSSSQISAA